MNSFHKILLLCSCIAPTTAALAQDAKIYGLSAEAPVFERVDQNGGDLVTGSSRATSPTYEFGSEEAKTIIDLQLTGKAWTHTEQPTLWRNNDAYIVNYMGTSQEFRNYSNNFAEKKPITGSKLNCIIWQPDGLTLECVYTCRNGDTPPFPPPPALVNSYSAI